jgi:transmembrane sensor
VIATDQQIRSAITERAAQWFMAHRVGALGESERAAFLAWLKASPLHVEEYLGVAALERSLQAATDDPDVSLDALLERAHQDTSAHLLELGSRPSPADASARSERTGRRGWPASRPVIASLVIVSLAIAVLSMLAVMRDGEWLNLPKTYETARGVQDVRRLPDGSILHLDTSTAVTVRFTSTERLLRVAHGQALFQVVPESRRPFRVVSGSSSTIAVGTEFDVYRRADTTLITVLKGQVMVSAAIAGQPQAVPVRAGQQLRVAAGTPLGVAERVDVGQAMAWLHRQIAFDRRPLGEVAEEFNRYNRIPITIDDPVLRVLRISGVFDAYDQDSFAAFLASLEGVRVEKLPTQIRVSSLHRVRSGAPR